MSLECKTMPRKRYPGEAPVKYVMCHSDKSSLSAPLSTGNYLHKKFKKVATADDCPEVAAVPAPVLTNDEYSVEGVWRHKCPYCKTVCTKPSALAKHLQVHSDERPFPCETCGFAFKTKSNLSKHCKSQSHTERLAKEEPEETKPKIYKPKFRTTSIYTELEEDRSKDLKTVIETVPLLAYKQEEDFSQPLNLTVASIKKYQNEIAPVENGQNELKGVYKLLLNQINKCNGNKEQPFCEMCGLKFNNKEDLVRHICDRSPNETKYPETKTVAIPLPSPGPLLGRTPLVEFHRSKEPEVPKPILVRMGNLGQQQDMLAIFQCGRDVPYVPGIPGPNTVIPHQFRPQYEPKKSEPPPLKKHKMEEEFVVSTSHHQILTTTITTTTVSQKFVRPTSLAFKPGTFSTNRMLPVVSPDTPRPKKSYQQLYLNGHAYTYLGLKCSTRVFYCTLTKCQPTYTILPEVNTISMYSNWKICSDMGSNILGVRGMDLYDSSQRNHKYTQATQSHDYIVAHSSYKHQKVSDQRNKVEFSSVGKLKICPGGFESNEDYVYVRGRGRGRYVCADCGIRCKKPSMLKKHIRTHTDLRPYTCTQCTFSFKTKGNLTKHMKSKAHFKKGVELDLNPMPIDDIKQFDSEDMEDYSEDNMDDDDDIDDEDDDEEAVDKLGWRKTQSDFDAARSLLRLSQVCPSQIPQSNHAKAGILPYDHRPVSYPYQSPLSIAEFEFQINYQNRTQMSSPMQTSNRLEVSPVSSTTVFNNPVVVQTTPTDLRHNVSAILNSSPKSIVNKPMDLSRFGGTKELEQINKSQVAGSQSSKKPKALFRQPTTNGPSQKYTSILEDGRSKCMVCDKVFNKPSQLQLHINIHYFEQPFRCESCKESFRTKHLLQKHLDSSSHLNKVNMMSTQGSIVKNPRPFECADCQVGFRIHGHLAKHLRSKMHILKLECLGKIPFGTYAEIERLGLNLNDIDTTDCDSALKSLQASQKAI
ncbi:gastrula zinc finger protein xFG20-1-like isoform X3 [Sipha flava]|uniref:Gastrula zinc finger protein xFG20-1-like isoform X3 n=1 Tax=Sipha flava TaxID=143950 RepID=A0A8B8FQL7_9HEMI|nr:gastrula zinc finger protein xFG20-1-like isoform X3 [Sipha flava]